jgi:hypothetical protein
MRFGKPSWQPGVKRMHVLSVASLFVTDQDPMADKLKNEMHYTALSRMCGLVVPIWKNREDIR